MDQPEKIQIWKVKQLIKTVESLRGANTSLISLMLPAKAELSKASAMLTEEYRTASIVKTRVSRPLVLAVLVAAQHNLKRYDQVPPNGLVLFVGIIITDEGREKKVAFHLEPHKPINTSIYICDNKFYTEAMSELLESDSRFGFIVMDGNGVLFGTLASDTRTIIHEFTVDLTKKFPRVGGASALCVSRLPDYRRHNYLVKVAQHAVQHFITNAQVNVAGIVLAGSADFKAELSRSDMFDPRLGAKVIKIVDVNYGGEHGFDQAIKLSANERANFERILEQKLVQKYLDEIKRAGQYCCGAEDTLKALDLGTVETLIVWADLDITRYTLRNAAGEEIIVYANKEQEMYREKFLDKSTGLEMEQGAEPQKLLEWLVEKYKNFGATLELVTARSEEGAEFIKGSGGIGGLLTLRAGSATPGSDEGDFQNKSDEQVV